MWVSRASGMKLLTWNYVFVDISHIIVTVGNPISSETLLVDFPFKSHPHASRCDRIDDKGIIGSTQRIFVSSNTLRITDTVSFKKNAINALRKFCKFDSRASYFWKVFSF